MNGKPLYPAVAAVCALLFLLSACKPSGTGMPSSGAGSSSVSLDPGCSLATGDFTFTPEEILAQEEAGDALTAELRKAAKDLSVSEYTIPSGDYGFRLKTNMGGVMTGFILYGVERPDDNPFTIHAEGATFWFHTTGLPSASVGKCFTLINCSNIVVEGLTIDSYEKNTIEGRLLKADIENRQLEIELYPDTLTNPSKIYRIGDDPRIIPVKANGDFITPYYKVGSSHGPTSCKISKLEKGSADGRLLITLAAAEVLNTMEDPLWKQSYGPEGTLEIGDDIVIIYGAQLAVSLDNCRTITMKNIDCFMTRGGFWENGGYGAHRWINCRFISRPGTDAVFGGDGCMSQWLRVGSTFDGLQIGKTSDDAFNIHGIWSRVTAVSGNTATFDIAPCAIEAGDPVLFYSIAGELAASCTVAEVPSGSLNWTGQYGGLAVKLDGDIPANAADYRVRWPACECDGWAIRNCTLDGIYQRILIQSGPGVLENNIIRGMGCYVEIKNADADIETGFAEDIMVRSNVFIDCCIYPGGNLFEIASQANWFPRQKLRGITITGNVFLGTGNALIHASQLEGLTVTDNVIIDPIRHTAIARPAGYIASACVTLANADQVTVSDNVLVQQTLYTSNDPVLAFVSTAGSADVTGNMMRMDPKSMVRAAVLDAWADGDEAADIAAEIMTLAKGLPDPPGAESR